MPAKSTKKTQEGRAPVAPIPRNNMTKIGNNNALFLDGVVDMRGGPGRRFKELTRITASDIGGWDSLSEVQKQLIRRHSALCVLAETAEASIANGEEVDATAFVTLINAQNRLAGSIGIARVALDVTPNLQSYLADKYAQSVQDADDDEDVGEDQKDD